MGTKPVAEHAWLQNLLGDWEVTSEMMMPDGSTATSEGKESCKSLGGLWAFSQGEGTMPNGEKMEMYWTLGYDVSFKEYRGCWFMSVSSHLWKYVGTLSEDGKRMTLNCEGPSMVEDGKTALYRDVIDLIDANTRTLTSYGQDEKGEWQQFMKAAYTRV
ncbi:DUF1579 domain-containing protein [bacterium]|nr:MAG: DUF1579 domain-containing protein [bacterium]